MKIKITLAVEFDINKDNYDEDTTDQEALDIEIANASDEPAEYLSNFTTEDITISGELIP